MFKKTDPPDLMYLELLAESPITKDMHKDVKALFISRKHSEFEDKNVWCRALVLSVVQEVAPLIFQLLFQEDLAADCAACETFEQAMDVFCSNVDTINLFSPDEDDTDPEVFRVTMNHLKRLLTNAATAFTDPTSSLAMGAAASLSLETAFLIVPWIEQTSHEEAVEMSMVFREIAFDVAYRAFAAETQKDGLPPRMGDIYAMEVASQLVNKTWSLNSGDWWLKTLSMKKRAHGMN